MGTKGIEIVGMDVKELLELLNKALADEWLAYYQYWVGSKVVKGPMRDAVEKELLEHANEELNHANLLVDRIVQLGGTPILSPDEWNKMTNCGYDAPTDGFVKKILEQNIKGEQCAIDVYKKLADLTKDKDPITWQLAIQIMQEEVEHEQDLQDIMEDIELATK